MTTPQSQSIDSVFTEENVDTLLEECAMPGLLEEEVDCKSLLRMLESQKGEADNMSSGSERKEEEEGEGAPLGRLQQRQKQIRIGKSTYGYQQYLLTVEKDQRGEEELDTPPTSPSSLSMSKRNWDKELRKWRKFLHHYDKPQDGTTPETSTQPTQVTAQPQLQNLYPQMGNIGNMGMGMGMMPFLGAPMQPTIIPGMGPVSYVPVQMPFFVNQNGMMQTGAMQPNLGF